MAYQKAIVADRDVIFPTKAFSFGELREIMAMKHYFVETYSTCVGS